VKRQEREIGRKSGVSFGDSGTRRTSIDTEKFSGTATKKVIQPPPRAEISGTVKKLSGGSKPAPTPATAKPPLAADYGDLVNKLAKAL